MQYIFTFGSGHPASIALQGIATHGVALNVSTDLSFYSHIVACGMANLDATSLKRELGYQPAMPQVAAQFVDAFRNTFGYEKALPAESVEG